MDPQTLQVEPTYLEQVGRVPDTVGVGGILFIILLALMYFFHVKVWPFAVAQFEQRSKDIEKLLVSHDEDRKIYQQTISNMSDSLIKVDYRLGALEETTDKRMGAIETSLTNIHRQIETKNK